MRLVYRVEGAIFIAVGSMVVHAMYTRYTTMPRSRFRFGL